MVVALGLAHKANLVFFRVQPGGCLLRGQWVRELVAALAVVAFEAVAVGITGWMVGGLVFGSSGDPMDEFGYDGEAGAEDYRGELTHASHIVSMAGKPIASSRDKGALTSIGRL